jgi:succinate dehydrogenase/fumarate reductase flavoprotein subunit
MHISEIGFCSGHSASGVWVNEKAETTVPGLYAAGDMASVPHNYMLGAFTYGWFAGQNAAAFCGEAGDATVDPEQIAIEKARVAAPLERSDGIPPAQLEYKLRRMVNDYLQPPKVTRKMLLGLERFSEIGEDLPQLVASNPHELMRALEVGHIYDCARMAAHASLFRTESRWGLYHYRADYPERNDAEWFTHCHLRRSDSGAMESIKRPVEPYILPLDEEEKTAYQRLRIVKEAASA